MDSNATITHNLSATNHSDSRPFSLPFNVSLDGGTFSTGILVVGLNTLAVLVTLTQASLRTPFNMYIVAILCSNVALGCLDRALDIAEREYGAVRLGHSLCTIHLYAIYVISPLVYNFHWLVTLNRVWALFGPISYRARHNRTIAGILCGAVMVYVHSFMLPLLIRDRLYYRLPLEGGCRLNNGHQPALAALTTFLIYDVPKVGIPVVFPFLLWKMYSRRRAIRPVANPAAPAPTRPEGGRPFTLLTLYTGSTLFCWWPMMCCNIILTYSPNTKLHPALYRTAASVYIVQTVLDPLMFILTLGNIRSCWRRLCKTKINNQGMLVRISAGRECAAARNTRENPNAIPNVAIVA
ncbi:adrenocorticotropic hormone receptor-like [Paramacrobiotus metropolitanus]|uniref:adrenocorticotropic hormone receptor-like n=1 Tax=Paramacrobiotus metropolitanus TaxID=2943436 RepID=UPI0024465584|nr:adrenocorticotropic hormone receptor-like [Paramacrobiotus metropolitanus]